MASFSPRPDEIKIGWHTWTVNWHGTDEWIKIDPDNNKDGLTLGHLLQIHMRLIEDRPESLYHDVLWHEIMHAAFLTVGLALEADWNLGEANDIEEKVCLYGSPVFVGVLKDNPVLVKWLTSDGKRVSR